MAEPSDRRGSDGRFGKGFPKPPNSGRPKGGQNKTTRAVKEFLAELCDSAEVQGAVKDRILSGDTIGFFRALDHVLGRAKESVDMNLTVDIAERVRLAGERHLKADKK